MIRVNMWYYGCYANHHGIYCPEVRIGAHFQVLRRWSGVDSALRIVAVDPHRFEEPVGGAVEKIPVDDARLANKSTRFEVFDLFLCENVIAQPYRSRSLPVNTAPGSPELADGAAGRPKPPTAS